jgi:hypothetical protein
LNGEAKSKAMYHREQHESGERIGIYENITGEKVKLSRQQS